jgi:predicted GTPase
MRCAIRFAEVVVLMMTRRTSSRSDLRIADLIERRGRARCDRGQQMGL